MADARWARLTPEGKKKRSDAVMKCRCNRHKKLKELAGGKCSVCGYSRCFRSLGFHHTDKTQKEFGLAVGGITRSWDSMVKEITKCALVCHNCHMEIEEGITVSPPPLGVGWEQQIVHP